MNMIDKARIAVMDVLQRGNLPPGTDIDSEAIVRAVMNVMREPTDGQRNAYYELSGKTETIGNVQ